MKTAAIATPQNSYQELFTGLRRELKPNGVLQTEIFTRLVRVFWILRSLDAREDQVLRETGLPLVAQGTKEFENTLRYRRFLAKEERELTAHLSQLQTEAAIRDLDTDFQAFERHSVLVSIRPLVELHNLRCATKNHGNPRITYTAGPTVTRKKEKGPGLEPEPLPSGTTEKAA